MLTSAEDWPNSNLTRRPSRWHRTETMWSWARALDMQGGELIWIRIHTTVVVKADVNADTREAAMMMTTMAMMAVGDWMQSKVDVVKDIYLELCRQPQLGTPVRSLPWARHDPCRLGPYAGQTPALPAVFPRTTIRCPILTASRISHLVHKPASSTVFFSRQTPSEIASSPFLPRRFEVDYASSANGNHRECTNTGWPCPTNSSLQCHGCSPSASVYDACANAADPAQADCFVS